jgi:hypothetical protein
MLLLLNSYSSPPVNKKYWFPVFANFIQVPDSPALVCQPADRNIFHMRFATGAMSKATLRARILDNPGKKVKGNL